MLTYERCLCKSPWSRWRSSWTSLSSPCSWPRSTGWERRARWSRSRRGPFAAPLWHLGTFPLFTQNCHSSQVLNGNLSTLKVSSENEQARSSEPADCTGIEKKSLGKPPKTSSGQPLTVPELLELESERQLCGKAEHNVRPSDWWTSKLAKQWKF